MRLSTATIVVCVVIFALTAALRFLAVVSFSNDEYIGLVGAQQMLFGEWPTRDFFDPGLPMAYAASAAAQLLFGRNLFAEAVLTSTAIGLAAGLTVVTARRLSGSLAIGILAALFEVAIFPRGYAYPAILLYAAAPLLIWWYQERPTSWVRMLALALFVQVAFLLRHDHGLFTGIVVALAAATGSGAPTSTREVGRRVASLALLMFVAAVPYLTYVSLNGGLVRYFAQGIAFSAAEAADNHLVLPPFGQALSLAKNCEAFLFFLFYLLPVSAALVWVTTRGRDRWTVFARIAPIIVMAILVDRAFLRDELATRLANAIVPAVLLCAWLAGEISRAASPGRRAMLRTAALAVAIVCGVAVTTVGRTEEQFNRAGLFGGLRRMPERFAERSAELHERFNERQMPSRLITPLIPFFEYVDRCTTTEHHLLLPGFSPEVAVYAGRPFAGGRYTMLKGYVDDPDARRQLQERVEAQVVPFVVIEPNYKERIWSAYPELARFIDGRFRSLVSYRSDSGNVMVEVLVNRTLTPRAQDPATGWPCFR